MLPDYLVCLAVDRRKSSVHGRADRRSLPATDITQTAHVFVAITRKGAAAYRARHIEIACVGTIWHRRPVGPTNARRLNQHWGLPEGLKDTTGLVVARHQFGTLRDGRITDRNRLRLRCFLSRILRYRAFFDAYQGFTISTVKDVHPASSAGFSNPLARLAVDSRVEENNRASRIVVPDIVVHLLKMPNILTSFSL